MAEPTGQGTRDLFRDREQQKDNFCCLIMAEPTGLEPATSSVTGKRSNQLSYGSTIWMKEQFFVDRAAPFLSTLRFAELGQLIYGSTRVVQFLLVTKTVSQGSDAVLHSKAAG